MSAVEILEDVEDCIIGDLLLHADERGTLHTSEAAEGLCIGLLLLVQGFCALLLFLLLLDLGVECDPESLLADRVFHLKPVIEGEALLKVVKGCIIVALEVSLISQRLDLIAEEK